MHVVDELEAEQRLEKPAEEHRLFMGMDEGVARPAQKGHGPCQYKGVQEQLEQRGAGLDVPECLETRDAVDPDTRNVDILALPIGQEIDLDTELGGHERPVIDAVRRPAGEKNGCGAMTRARMIQETPCL